jgi:VanZ family protein
MFALTIYGSLLPFNYAHHTFDEALAVLRQITLYPTSELGARGDWVISAVQFTVLCFLATGAIAVDRRPYMGLLAALAVVTFCLALAVAIEFLQVFFPPRTVSLNDIIVECVGGVAGVATWLVGGQRMTHWLRRFGNHSNMAALSKWQLPAYLVIVLVVQLMPFDFVISPDELAVKYREGKVHLVPFAGPWDVDALVKVLLNVACFLPLGFLLSFASGRRQRRWSGLPLLALAVPAVVEFLQFFVYSRSCDATDIITGAAGVWTGAWLAQALRARLARSTATPSDRVGGTVATWAALLAGYSAWFGLLLYFSWRPFDFTADSPRLADDVDAFSPQALGRLVLLPFVDYYWGSKYNALDQFIRKSLAFLPLGALMALSSRDVFPRRRIWLVVVVALFVGGIVEVGRCYLPNRIPSTTDVLIGCCAAAIGFRITQYFRAVFWAESALFGWIQPQARSHSPVSPSRDVVQILFTSIRRR